MAVEQRQLARVLAVADSNTLNFHRDHDAGLRVVLGPRRLPEVLVIDQKPGRFNTCVHSVTSKVWVFTTTRNRMAV